MLTVNHLSGFGAYASATPPSISYRAVVVNTSDLTTYTNTHSDTGTAGANRTAIIGVIGTTAGGATISSVKVHVPDVATDPTGTTANIQCQITGVRGVAGIATCALPTGTAAAIVVVFSSGALRCHTAFWAGYDLASATATDSATSTAAPLALDMDTVTGDVLVAIGVSNNPTSATPTGYTERFDAQDADTVTYTGGDHTAVSTETPRTVTITIASSDNPGSAAAVFR